jgi:hypothetical protein
MNKLKNIYVSKIKGTVSKVLESEGGFKHIVSLPHKKIKYFLYLCI